jgi:hypothetical protein
MSGPRVEAGGFIEKFFSSQFSAELCDAVGASKSKEVARVRWCLEMDSAVFELAGDEAGEVDGAVEGASGLQCVACWGYATEDFLQGRG